MTQSSQSRSLFVRAVEAGETSGLRHYPFDVPAQPRRQSIHISQQRFRR